MLIAKEQTLPSAKLILRGAWNAKKMFPVRPHMDLWMQRKEKMCAVMKEPVNCARKTLTAKHCSQEQAKTRSVTRPRVIADNAIQLLKMQTVW